jgi:hypothetical protein
MVNEFRVEPLTRFGVSCTCSSASNEIEVSEPLVLPQNVYVLFVFLTWIKYGNINIRYSRAISAIAITLGNLVVLYIFLILWKHH